MHAYSATAVHIVVVAAICALPAVSLAVLRIAVAAFTTMARNSARPPSHTNHACVVYTVHVGSPRLCRAHIADTRRHAQQDVDDQGGNTCRRSRSFWSKRHSRGVARDLGQNHNRGARVPARSHRHHVTSPARMHRPKRVSRHKKRGKPTCQPHPLSPGVVGQRQRCRSRRRNSPDRERERRSAQPRQRLQLRWPCRTATLASKGADSCCRS